jgi:hypothetical protein
MLKNNTSPFQLRAGHFAVLIAAFFLCTTWLSAIRIRRMPESTQAVAFPTLDGRPTGAALCAVFFHDGSPLCNKMRYNWEQVALHDRPDLHYRVADVAAHPQYGDEYRLSGLPVILVFKNDEEVLRIMGIVSQSNLKKIYAKIR